MTTAHNALLELCSSVSVRTCCAPPCVLTPSDTLEQCLERLAGSKASAGVCTAPDAAASIVSNLELLYFVLDELSPRAIQDGTDVTARLQFTAQQLIGADLRRHHLRPTHVLCVRVLQRRVVRRWCT